jgi:anti-sigma regulatory factor (Ser/Thr protein kinase)
VSASSASFEWSFDAAPFDVPAGGVMALLLDHDYAMVGAARRAVGTWLRERGCRTGDDAVLVLSELVMNAMVHAAAGCTIELRHSADLLRLEVRDRSPQVPVMRSVGPSDVGGRGLHVVDAVAEAWGWEPTADGKRVWAIVHAAVHHPDGDGRAASPSS